VRGEDVVILGTLVAAQIGDHKQAETFIQEMNRQWPEDTFVQKYWLPVIRALMDIHDRRWSKAVSDLDPAAPFDLASPPHCRWRPFIQPTYGATPTWARVMELEPHWNFRSSSIIPGWC
jgi:hypothetical protein